MNPQGHCWSNMSIMLLSRLVSLRLYIQGEHQEKLPDLETLLPYQKLSITS
jgi:hypothetical protein